MATDVTDALQEFISNNEVPHPAGAGLRQRPDYGITASLEGDCLTMTLTFRSSRRYCCMEWGCHLPLGDSDRWAQLRRILSAREINAPDQLRLRLHVNIEEGAEFFDLSRPDPARRGSYAFRRESAKCYEASSVELSDTR